MRSLSCDATNIGGCRRRARTSCCRDATEACGSWASEREIARRAALDPAGLVDVLLADGEPDAAWDVVVGTPEWEPRERQWVLLAEVREASHPADALAVYVSFAEGELSHADRGRTPEQRRS